LPSRYLEDSRVKEIAESRIFARMDKDADDRKRRARVLDERAGQKLESPLAPVPVPLWVVGPELSGSLDAALDIACRLARAGDDVRLVTRLSEGDLAGHGESLGRHSFPFAIEHVKPLESYASKIPDCRRREGPSALTFFLPLSARLAEAGVKHICVLSESGEARTACDTPGISAEMAEYLACLPDFLAGAKPGTSLGRRVFPASPETLGALLGVPTPPLPPAPHVPTVSACLIVKDEEGMIEECLRSLVPVADQTVINDTGSEDDTVRIASEFGAEVFRSTWEGDFSRARNLALERAKSDYILSIDADERLDPATASFLKDDLVKGSEAYHVDISNEMDSGVSVVISAYRVFQNSPRHRFTGRVHEQVEPRGPTPRSDARILHLGYLKDISSARGKRQRNMALLRASVGDEGLDPGRRLYYRYQTGVELMASGDLPGALRVLEEVHREVPRTSCFAPHASLHLCEAYLRCGRLDEAVRHARAALKAYPGFEALAELVASALCDRERFSEALELLSLLVAAARSPLPLPKIDGSDTYLLHLLKARIAAGLGDVAAALPELTASLRAKPEWGPAQTFLVRRFPARCVEVLAELSPATVRPAAVELLQAGKTDEALQLASSMGDAGAEGEVLLSLGRFEEAAPLLQESADPWDRDRGACLALLGLARTEGPRDAGKPGSSAEVLPGPQPGEALRCVLNGTPAARGRLSEAVKALGFLLDLRSLDRFTRGLAALSRSEDPDLLAGRLLYQKGFPELAYGPLTSSYRKTRNPESLAMLASVASGRRMYREAAGYFHELRSFRALALDQYAAYLSALLATGEARTAREVLGDAVSDYPDSQELRLIASRWKS
jgi:tetratricopeptide (TPR) repeat protein